MQNIPILPNVDHTDAAAAVGLIPGACAREMYRPAYAIHLTIFSSNSRDEQYSKLLWKVISEIPGGSERKLTDIDEIHNY